MEIQKWKPGPRLFPPPDAPQLALQPRALPAQTQRTSETMLSIIIIIIPVLLCHVTYEGVRTTCAQCRYGEFLYQQQCVPACIYSPMLSRGNATAEFGIVGSKCAGI